MKKSIVILTALNGALFTQSKNADGSPKLDKNGEEFGYLRVENPSTVDLAYAHVNGGVKRGQSALVSMTCAAWEKVKRFYSEGMEIAGRVRVEESLEQKPGFQPKLAGANGTPCTLDGKQIYRSTRFISQAELDKNPELNEDVTIQHNNVIVGSSVAPGQALNRN